jgi:hypothetical protein
VVWLGRDSQGKVTYTFSPRRGLIGGKLIPELALCAGRRIDARKKDEVAEILLGFGLTLEEAEDVIQAVGASRSSRRAAARRGRPDRTIDVVATRRPWQTTRWIEL